MRGSMDAMERGVTVAPQLFRQETVRQPVLIERAYNGSCLHDTSTDGILRFQTVTYRMYICTFVAKRADGRIVLNEEKL